MIQKLFLPLRFIISYASSIFLLFKHKREVTAIARHTATRAMVTEDDLVPVLIGWKAYPLSPHMTLEHAAALIGLLCNRGICLLESTTLAATVVNKLQLLTEKPLMQQAMLDRINQIQLFQIIHLVKRGEMSTALLILMDMEALLHFCKIPLPFSESEATAAMIIAANSEELDWITYTPEGT